MYSVRGGSLFPPIDARMSSRNRKVVDDFVYRNLRHAAMQCNAGSQARSHMY